MRTIPLPGGYETIIDYEDYDWLSRFSWKYSKGYAVRTGYLGRVDKKSIYKAVLMHRQIMQALPGFDIDHINGNRLDNRRSNLRLATRKQNQQNKYKKSNISSSPYKGVSFHKPTGKWQAYIHIGNDRKPTALGYYRSAEEAAIAYNTAAMDNFGNFAKLNMLKTAW